MTRFSTTHTLNTGSDDEREIRVTGSICEHVRFIEPYVGRSLEWRARARFELHMVACEHCRNAVEFELLVERVVGDTAKFAQFSRSWH
jgi:hypothetical protein